MKRDIPTGKSFDPPPPDPKSNEVWIRVRTSSGDDVCGFPKHEGKPWTLVIEEDPDYVSWILSGEGPLIGPTLYEKLTEMMEER
jgi:hypothetical protein